VKLTLYLADQSEVEVANFDAGTVMDLAQALSNERVLVFELGEPDMTVLVRADQVVRIEVQ
jgi:hypothetical protein